VKHPWRALATAQDKQRKLLKTYHSGPQVTTGKPKEDRGPRPQEFHTSSKVKVIVAGGRPLMTDRLKAALPNIIAAEAKLAAQRNQSPELDAESLVTALGLPGRADVSANASSSARPGRRGAGKDSTLA
jgi:hypothetical protein